MKLTPNFSLEEFTASDIARNLGIDNTPPAAIVARLRVTALGAEMVRRVLGGPLRITSGYRNEAVNKAAKGTSTSDHLSGWAFDFVRPGLTPFEAAAKLRDSALTWDQLILEADRGVVHVSFDPQLRRKVQTQKGGAGKPLIDGLVA